MSEYESRGEEEKAAIAKLKEHMGSLDEKLANIPQLQSKDLYHQQETDFIRTFLHGDLQKLGEIVSTLEVRRLPYAAAHNRQTRFPELYNLDHELQWPILLTMIMDNGASEEKIIENIKFLQTNGFNFRQFLA